jgi:hypothetical protein
VTQTDRKLPRVGCVFAIASCHVSFVGHILTVAI